MEICKKTPIFLITTKLKEGVEAHPVKAEDGRRNDSKNFQIQLSQGKDRGRKSETITS